LAVTLAPAIAAPVAAKPSISGDPPPHPATKAAKATAARPIVVLRLIM
jgi:hypothetical protein